MESPWSARRITRSQTRAALANSATRKMEDSENALSKTKQRTAKQDRSVLIDITNDSPIVGLASGNLETPISSMSKQRSNRCKMTPGSGEALLRSQVKNLLQRVEEGAVISKFSLQIDDFPIPKNLKAFLNSPAALIAPTPANTPQVLNFSAMDEFESLGSVSRSPIEDELNISKVVSGIFDEKNKKTENSSESEKDVVSRTLFLDFSEKSDSSSDCSSVVTYQGIGSEIKGKLTTMEDDDASIWSIQVNASTRDEDEDEDDAVVIDDDVYDEDYEVERVEDEAELLLLDELCEGISNIDVNGKRFMGKHTKFVYNSDDELVEEREECVLRLKGLPTPKGKHLRFQDEEL